MAESSPAPTPSRAYYGFALYLASKSAFILYLLWCLFPSLFPFFPQVYWAIAVPIVLLDLLALVAFVLYPALSLRMTPPADDSRTLRDKHSITEKTNQPVTGEAIRGVPKLYDIPIEKVSKMLYLNN